MFKKFIFSSLVIIFGITGIVHWLTVGAQAKLSPGDHCTGNNKCVINEDGDLYFFTPNTQNSIYFNAVNNIDNYGLAVQSSGLYSNGQQVVLNSESNEYSIMSKGFWGSSLGGPDENRDVQIFGVSDKGDYLGDRDSQPVGLVSTYYGRLNYDLSAQLAFVRKDNNGDILDHVQYRFSDSDYDGWKDDWTVLCDSSNNCNTPFLADQSFSRGVVPILRNDLLGGSPIYIEENKGSYDVYIAGDNSKLYVNTVDPVYTINQKKYATYMAGMVGLKEETSGVLVLKKQSSGLLMASLDFQNASEGSDLWLFGRVVNLIKNQEHFNQTACLLTPSFAGQVWYEKDINNRIINIFARPDNSKQEQVEVSYRLTGPRFDQDQRDNYSDSKFEGLNLDRLIP